MMVTPSFYLVDKDRKGGPNHQASADLFKLQSVNYQLSYYTIDFQLIIYKKSICDESDDFHVAFCTFNY